MGISEQNQTAERNYGYTTSKPKPKNMAKKVKHFKAIVTKGRHKTQPYSLTFDERVDSKVKQRYANERNACIGAVRHYREQLIKAGLYDIGVLITLPNNRERMGFMWSNGAVYLQAVTHKKK